VLLDVADRIPDRAELLDCHVWDIETEFVLDPDLDEVEAIHPERVEGGAISQRGGVDRPDVGDDLADPIRLILDSLV
jgi:hypothetical protein